MEVTVRAIQDADVDRLEAAFSSPDWSGGKPRALFEGYLRQHEAGERDVLLAFASGALAGYMTIRWEPAYPPFRESEIPTVEDLNVLISYRRKRVASAMMGEAERRIAIQSDIAGIGVGMDGDYGPAQRMYVRRGYIPDGRGLTSHDRHVKWGEMVRVDDDLVLFLTKELGPNGSKD